MKIPFSPPDITENEIALVIDALSSGWITTGPKTKDFEKRIVEYTNASGAVCLNSATAALELALHLLGVGPGDEVITSAYTYTASASVVCHVGAKLVLVDTAPDSYEMDYSKLEAAITEKTKAIIPVDIAGVMVDYESLFRITEAKKELFTPTNDIQKAIGRVCILADSAHGFGASKGEKKSGEVADFTAFSFHAVKNLTTAEGGALCWTKKDGVEDEDIYHRLQLLSLHGQDKDALAKTKLGGWEYDIVLPGYKCNMTDVAAAIGLAQLQRYPRLLARRREIIDQYNEGVKDLPVELIQSGSALEGSSMHLYLVRLTGKDRAFRDALIEKMAERDVATNVHYKPLPMHTAYKNLGFRIADYPNAHAQFENEITLPLHTKLTDAEVSYVIDVFRECYQQLEEQS